MMSVGQGERRVPQLWLTYEEIAEAFGCRPEVAEEAVVSGRWTRKRSRDMLVRALLPQDVMQVYVVNAAAKFQGRTTPQKSAAVMADLSPTAPGIG